MVAILGLAIVGMDWVSRVELGLLGLLILAQVDVVIGSFIPPSNQQMADGFVGINSTVLQVLKTNTVLLFITKCNFVKKGGWYCKY